MQMIHLNSWVVDQIKEKYNASDSYLCGEKDALNIGNRCNNDIIISLCQLFIL
jgi:hypothetical protein